MYFSAKELVAAGPVETVADNLRWFFSSAQSEAPAALATAPLARRSSALSDALVRVNHDSLPTLTLEIVLCACEGDSNRQIARYLGICVSTVKRHLAKVRAR